MATIRHQTPPSHIELERRARQHLDELTRDELAQSVRDMRAMGFGDYGIAQATGLSVEAVRQLLAERKP